MSVVEPEPSLHEVWRVQQQIGFLLVASVGVWYGCPNVVAMPCSYARYKI